MTATRYRRLDRILSAREDGKQAVVTRTIGLSLRAPAYFTSPRSLKIVAIFVRSSFKKRANSAAG